MVGITAITVRINGFSLWHKTYVASEAAVRLHHRLVKIHPFPNGNRRHARIMADALLARVYKAKPIDWAGGHDLQKMNDRRAAYIAALNGRGQGRHRPIDCVHRTARGSVMVSVTPLGKRW